MIFKDFAGFTVRLSFQIIFFSCLCSPFSAGSIAESYNLCLSFLLIFETPRAACGGAVLFF